jgi:hypothetical protein
MLKGVLLIKFDYKLGPIAEAMFPEGFIPREKLWNMALDVWVSSGAKDLSEAEGCVQTLFPDLGMIACIFFGKTKEVEHYALAVFFESKSKSNEQIWQMQNTVEEILKNGLNKLGNGASPEIVVKEVYYNVGNLIAKRRVSDAPMYVYDMFRSVFDTLSELIDLVTSLDTQSKDIIMPVLERHVERLAELALFLGGRKAVRELVKKVMEKL